MAVAVIVVVNDQVCHAVGHAVVVGISRVNRVRQPVTVSVRVRARVEGEGVGLVVGPVVIAVIVQVVTDAVVVVIRVRIDVGSSRDVAQAVAVVVRRSGVVVHVREGVVQSEADELDDVVPAVAVYVRVGRVVDAVAVHVGRAVLVHRHLVQVVADAVAVYVLVDGVAYAVAVGVGRGVVGVVRVSAALELQRVHPAVAVGVQRVELHSHCVVGAYGVVGAPVAHAYAHPRVES